MKGKHGKRLRRQSALSLLEAQIKSGEKPEKINGKTTENMIPLTEIDKKRINNDIQKLKTRIN